MLLGIDLGTGSLKASLVDRKGQEVRSASAAYDVLSPRPGWAESDPVAWLDAAASAVRACCDGAQVEAIGVGGQAHGVVPCEADGTSLRHAILWADLRSVAQLGAYRALPEAARARLANPIVTGMAGPSLLWLKANEPTVYRRATWALQAKDWLRLRLTGVAATEHADASMTLLYDLAAGGWAEDVIAALGLERALLPPIHGSASIVGRLTEEGATLLGLDAGLPVAAGAADSAASLLGNGFVRPGDTMIQVGTGMQIMAITESSRAEPSPRTHLYRTAGAQFYAMAAMQNCGIAFEWAREVLGLDWPAMYRAGFEEAAEGEDGPLFLPYLTGERTPHLDPAAAGAFVGLRLHHRRPALARAVFEGVAYALADGLEALRATGIEPDVLHLSGGGTEDARWRQLLADVLEAPLLWSPSAGSAAIGVALLAGIGVGIYPDLDAAGRLVRRKATERTRPRPSPHHRRQLGRFRAAYRVARSA